MANAGWSQMFLVQNALSVIKNNNTDFLEETAKDMDKALKDPSTSDDPKMWYARARIFQMVALNGDTNVNAIDPNAAEKSFEGYINFFENPGSKQSYINAANENFIYVYINLFNKSLGLSSKGKFTEANALLDNLKKVYKYEVPTNLLKENNLSINKINLSGYGNCYRGGRSYNDKGKEYIQALLDNGYVDANLYGYLANYALEDSDTAKALEFLSEGKGIDPTNMGLLGQEINLYISMNNEDALIDKVNQGIENEPTNSQLHFTRGFLNQKSNKIEEAEKDYLNAIKFDPSNYDAMLNLGGVYIDKAEALYEDMATVNMNDYAAQDAIMEKVKIEYNKALPLLIDVVDNKEMSDNKAKYNLLRSIKSIYVKLKDREKASEYLARMKELEQ